MNKLSTFMVDLGNTIVIVRNVPSQVCKQCGEVSYSDEVAKQLERIVSKVRDSITEIAVVNSECQVLKNIAVSPGSH